MKFKSTLAKEITKALMKDERTRDSIIEVIDENGVITLTGTATSREAADHAQNIARRQPNVISVSSDLHVDHGDADSLMSPPIPGIDSPAGEDERDATEAAVIVPPTIRLER